MKWWRRHRPPPNCVGCGHSQADHYPGCINVGPAPDFEHCQCPRFWGADFPMSSLIPPQIVCLVCERGDEDCPQYGEAPYPRRTT